MSRIRIDRLTNSLSHFVHKRLLWLMLATYGLAALFPDAGRTIRGMSLDRVGPWHFSSSLSLSMLMLGSLLFNAGVGVKLSQLREIPRSPGILALGLVANLVIPIAFIFAISQILGTWHNFDEVQNILVGLALVASMPIAGSSTAWAQNADGQLVLSLGLVLFSTMLSPLTTPAALHAVGLMTSGDYSANLHKLAAGGTSTFLAAGVLLPAVLGILFRKVAGEERTATMRPTLKLLNSVVLLVLNYTNASISLPQAFGDPDADFLAVTVAIVAGLCVVAFATGWLIARVTAASNAQRASLMFGLGMNNNGTGLVLASMALAEYPRVMLPIIFYNLAQHLIAGVVDRFLCRASAPLDGGRPAVTRSSQASVTPESRPSWAFNALSSVR